MPKAAKRNTFTAPTSAVRELEKEAEHVDPMEAHRASRVSDREDEYKVRARVLALEQCVGARRFGQPGRFGGGKLRDVCHGCVPRTRHVNLGIACQTVSDREDECNIFTRSNVGGFAPHTRRVN